VKAGWNTKPLGELCDVIGGGTPPKDRPDYYGGDIPWATVRDMRTDIITSTEHSITAEAVKSSATNIIPAGNVVIATRVGLGKVCLLAQDTAVNQDLRGIVPRSNKEINVAFLFAWFKSISEQIIAEGTGATVQGVKLPFIKGLAVPIPEMEEQHRIVTLLDEAFADIATAKANTEKNLQNARELFESHLQAAFTLQEGWTLKSFGELAEFRNGINFTKSSKGEAIKIVGVRDFQKNFWAPLDDLETIIPEGEMPASDLIQSGDILFVRSNGNPELIGRSLLVGDLQEPITHSGFTIKARVRDAQLSPIYLCHYLKSGLLRREMIEGGNGANIKSLNQGTLSRLKIAFPEKAKQLMLVEQLEKVQTEIAELEAIYRQKLTALDDLKKSLLHQAFSARL
jgi:type I restriction enzyme, S subunit